MEKKEMINKVTDFSSDLMEKHFPKGECKERGQALVFNAEMIVYVSDLFEQELDKAREEGFTVDELKFIRNYIATLVPLQKGLTEDGWNMRDSLILKLSGKIKDV